jgi:hypothetical protein
VRCSGFIEFFFNLKIKGMNEGFIFVYKGVTFEVVKNGKNAIMLNAKSDFYDCESIEVWYKRMTNDRYINGSFVKGGIKRPSNNDYPYTAHQFMRKHFKTDEEFKEVVFKRFNEYEQLLRPKSIQ